MNQHPEQKILDRLLGWLALYVILTVGIAVYAGKPAEGLSVLSNLVSGFAGAAFAIMRIGSERPPQP